MKRICSVRKTNHICAISTTQLPAFLKVLILLVIATPASATVNDNKDKKYTLYVGAFLPSAKTTIRVDDKILKDGTTVVLEDDLGVADEKTLGYFSLTYHLSSKSAIEASVFNLERSGRKSINSPISIGGSEFDINLSIATDFDGFAYRLMYRRQLYRTENFSVGLSAGIHATDFNATVKSVEIEELRENTSGLIPIPLIGVYSEFSINEDLQVSFAAEAIDLTIDSVRADARNALVNLRYQINPALGFNIGYQYYNIEGEADDFDKNFAGLVRYRYEGFTAGLSYQF